ncbi:MAG: PAS domain-containing protein [Butyricicoccus sp.]|nr:PAS domain-containing protein [Butyricicoccus sp.]
MEQNRLNAQMAAILRSRFKIMTTVHLDTGVCERVTFGGGARDGLVMTGDYETFVSRALSGLVHPDDVPAYYETLSLGHMREKARQTEDYSEEVCLYRQLGEHMLWIELHVLYVRDSEGVTAYILGQDVTREKKREETSNKALEDRAYIIGSLSSLFFATYYVNLEQDTFRTVAQQRRVGDLLGDEVKCSAALQIYADHFIHPDDRAEYLRVMNVDYLSGKLRWWKPSVEVEYRKLSGEPDIEKATWEWVRATVLLARTGTDDMPKTAVYVAQDINGRRCAM